MDTQVAPRSPAHEPPGRRGPEAQPGRIEALRRADERRSELLTALEPLVEIGCGGAKLDCRTLSPGCRCCTRGTWSCLFVNGACNAACFFCPAPQQAVGVPETAGLRFPSPRDYVDYVALLGFDGVSLSGGEPLLTPRLTLDLARRVKGRFGASVHLWMYTNGILADDAILGQLRDAGLDEIRFDLAAVGYRTDAVRRACRFIPTVTVEVPAVPEDRQRLLRRLPELADAGVRHLNLHQLRWTSHNGPRLAERGYTPLGGPEPVVVESELAALETALDVVTAGLGLGVNYCSFVYRHRHQGAAARRRAAALVRRDREEVTGAGYLRRLALVGPPDAVSAAAVDLERADPTGEGWTVTGAGDRIELDAVRLGACLHRDLELRVAYHGAALRPAVSYRRSFRELELNRRRSVFVEREPILAETELTGDELRWLRSLLASEEVATGCGGRLEELERMGLGWAPYE